MRLPNKMPTMYTLNYDKMAPWQPWIIFAMENPEFIITERAELDENRALLRYLTVVALEKALHPGLRPYIADNKELWNIGWKGGDCEDLVLYMLWLYRNELDSVVHGAFRWAICQMPDGQGHCVLTIETNKNTWIVDPASRRFMHWTQYPVEWIMRQAPGYWCDGLQPKKTPTLEDLFKKLPGV